MWTLSGDKMKLIWETEERKVEGNLLIKLYYCLQPYLSVPLLLVIKSEAKTWNWIKIQIKETMRQKDHKERTFVIILFSPNWIFWEGLRWELVDVFCVGKCNQSLIGKIMMLLSAAIICNNLHENCFKLFAERYLFC